MRKKVVEIKNLSYSYPNGTVALKSVSLDIFEGETVAIIGPNGAGKSTLVLHLNGILRSNNGRVHILGLEMNHRNLREIRKRVGIVFQNPDDQLFMPTVFDDVAFGPINMGLSESEVKQRVEKALQEVGMQGYENRSPHHLSFGEKKRISLATALSMRPEILVIDEPTSNLDPKGRRGLIKLLQGIETTKVIATHDLEMVLEVCQRAVILSDGKIVANDRARILLANEHLLETHQLEVPISLRLSTVSYRLPIHKKI